MEFITYIRWRDRFKKAACLFAGLGHMQPLLLATTNSHYLLDRFCMERCCSGEYISRIVTSLIFMEILATLLVACLGVYVACKKSTDLSGRDLNSHNEEEWYRGPISSGIQFVILLGYIQIYYAFTTGGKKGHMHWFYSSLMIQQFVCLLIGGAIGFWEAGTTLWYLMAIPMGPIPVFFYQLMIHSWIRNNGPRDVEYIVVEWQIGLALCISILATLSWILAYTNPYIPIELEIEGLNTASSTDPSTTDPNRIATENGKAITLARTGEVTGNADPLNGIPELSNVTAKVTLTGYSVTVITIQPSGGDKYATANLTAGLKIQFSKSTRSAGAVQSVEVESATKGTGEPTLTSPSDPKVYSSSVAVTHDNSEKSVTISLTVEELTLSSSNTEVAQVIVTIPVKIEVVKTEKDGEAPKSVPVTITSVNLTLNVPQVTGTTAGTVESVTIQPPTIAGDSVPGTKTLNITVTAGNIGTNAVQAVGTVFSPTKPDYCIYSIRDKDGDKDIWANIGGKCEFAACYYRKTNNTPAFLMLYFRTTGGTPNIRYFGKTADTNWYEITEDKFYEKLPTLASGSLTLSEDGTPTPQYNRVFDNIRLSPVWLPLVMHGMAVGSFGSIFPNLIPKTLVCARTTRTLSVVSIFLSPLPHIINLAFSEYDSNPASCAWTNDTGKPWEGWGSWTWAYSLYLIYGLAFLFAIFNVHSPEWKLCCYIRSHGWMPFMMTLSTTLIIEILIAIARAGIMMQKPASSTGKDKNHPLLWNKMACLMSLSYLPFWMTTTPMMKSYVSSLDPFLCDKDRDHWPTARYGRLRSFGYWCKCACRGLYNSPRKLITCDMRKALTRKDPPLFYILRRVHGYTVSLQSPLILPERISATE